MMEEGEKNSLFQSGTIQVVRFLQDRAAKRVSNCLFCCDTFFSLLFALDSIEYDAKMSKAEEFKNLIFNFFFFNKF